MQTAATTNMQPCLGGLTINIVFAYKITALNELKMPSNMPAAAVLPTGSVHRERHIDGWTAALQKAVAIRTHTSAWKGRARKTLPARPNRLLRGRCSSICREMAPTPEMFPAQYDVEYHLKTPSIACCRHRDYQISPRLAHMHVRSGNATERVRGVDHLRPFHSEALRMKPQW